MTSAGFQVVRQDDAVPRPASLSEPEACRCEDGGVGGKRPSAFPGAGSQLQVGGAVCQFP